MTYRHVTNLRTPFDKVDLEFLSALPDYRLGEPVPAKPVDGNTPLALNDLRAKGIVGLYATEESMSDPVIQKKTGWGKFKMIGPEWTPLR